MQCSRCEKTAILASSEAFCKEHFFSHFEKTVLDTISKFNLLSKEQRIAVACSGGKDSSVLLYILKNQGYNVTALAVDEGIAGYRDKTLEDLRLLCAQLNVPLKLVSYAQNFGTTLDLHLAKNPSVRACSVCGVWRRSLLNKAAREFDAIATGHNLDDEAQSVLMNLFKANTKVLARMGPRSGTITNPSFTARVKPLYFCSEKETAAYALLKQFPVQFTECPNATTSMRAFIRDEINSLELSRPGAKRAVIDWFLSNIDEIRSSSLLHTPIALCKLCGEPTEHQICRACEETKNLEIPA